jgi:hypothetical protein
MHSAGPQSGPWLATCGEIGPPVAAQRPTAHGRSRPTPTVLTARGAGATRWARSPRSARVWGGAMARRPWAHRRLACRGVEVEGTRAVGGVRRARWEKARLTEGGGHQWGGGERLTRRCSNDGGRSDGGW